VEQIVKALQQIIVDLAKKKINVSAVKSKEQQLAYVSGLPKATLPKGPKLKAAQSLANVLASLPQPAPPPPPPPVSPLDRKTLVPKDFAIAIANQKAAQVFYELRTLNVEKYPVSGAVLLRTLVEASMDIYCRNNNISLKHTSGKDAGKSLSLAEKIEAVLQSVVGQLSKQQSTAARLGLTSKDSVISIQRLHEYVHNPSVFPSKNDLIGSWSSVEALFKVILK